MASYVLVQVGAGAAVLKRSVTAAKGMPRNLLTVAVEVAKVVVVPVRGPVSTVAEGLVACLGFNRVEIAGMARDRRVRAWSFMALVMDGKGYGVK